MNLNPFLLTLFFLASFTGYAQTLTVVTEQELDFGTFYITGSASGSVTVSNTGSWSATPNIHAIHSTHSAAIFTLSTDSPDPINVQVDQPVLNMTNAQGKQLLLETTVSNPQSVSIQQGAPVQMMLGGTLTVDSQADPGNYSGELFVTFTIFNE